MHLLRSHYLIGKVHSIVWNGVCFITFLGGTYNSCDHESAFNPSDYKLDKTSTIF